MDNLEQFISKALEKQAEFKAIDTRLEFHDFDKSDTLIGIFIKDKQFKLEGKEVHSAVITNPAGIQLMAGSNAVLNSKLTNEYIGHVVIIKRLPKPAGKKYFDFDVKVGPKAPPELFASANSGVPSDSDIPF